jgi:hypothetical protein
MQIVPGVVRRHKKKLIALGIIVTGNASVFFVRIYIMYVAVFLQIQNKIF